MSAVLEPTAGGDPAEIRGKPRVAPAMERFSYDDKVVRAFTLMTLVWSLVAFLVGLIVAAELVIPSVIAYAHDHGIGWLENALGAVAMVPQLSFGRLRPLHTNAAIFAFAGNAIFAGVYYSTQRLCKARMWSDKLSWLHFWGWQAIIVAAAITLPLGITQGKEYAELEWPIDLMIAVVWLGFFGTNLIMTMVKRRERHMYVALWFYIATLVAVTVLHVFNSLVVPAGWFKSYSVYAGVQDAFMQWWYGHNAVAFFLTTPFLGMMYYFVPKAADRPVYSYRLSIVHFWSLVFIYIWAGPHHLHYTALPEWASTLGMVFSLMLWMPSWGGMINGLLTLRGAWHKVSADPVLKFFVVAITFYGMSTFEGPMLSIKSVNSLSHYTDWTIAHVHSGALGWNGFMAFGMIYWLLPRLFQTKLYSQKLANAHFWLATVGILLYIIAIYVAGLTQGLMWRATDDKGVLQYPSFIETVVALIPMYWLRILGGSMYMLGGLFCAVNFYKTWASRPAVLKETIVEAPALAKDYVDPPIPASPLADKPVADIGKKLAPIFAMWFHRRWEARPVLFTVWTVVAVAVASLFEIIPTFLIRANVPTIASVQPYTPLELYGRRLYVQEGCYNCHSQMIRPILPETARYTEYSKPGEFVYDHPFQWGSRRIGPDLAREGGKQSADWHFQHFQDPQKVTPGSLMPRYGFFESRPISFEDLQSDMKAMVTLGVPYTTEQVASAQEDAKKQATQIAAQIGDQEKSPALAKSLADKQTVALVAYLQRLGTDLKKTAAAASQPATTTSKPATEGAK
jgi:cytochrome c oxidase cbb3-type subunit I/II